MVFLKLLLISCLTFITAEAFRNDINIELHEKHLDIFHIAVPEHYNVQLEPDVETNIFHGECNISIHVRVLTQSLMFYSKIKCINDIILINNPPRFYGSVEDMIIYPIEYDKVDDRIGIYFRNFLSPGNYILNIKYHGIMNHETKVTTLYKQEYEWWLMPTHFDILGAREVFPCLSEFLPATFNIIIKHHRDYAALSNMAVKKVEEDDEDMTLTHFQTTPLLSTYLIAGIVTNFSNSTASLDTSLWYRNSSALYMKFADHVIKHTTLYLKKKWYRGHEIRSTKVNHIAIPNFSDKNMMNLGLVIYREEDIIYDEKLQPLAHKIEISHLIGYKISQEWFYQFSDTIWKSTTFWFNDCLIRFLGTYAVHEAVPKLRIMDLFVVQSHHEVLDFDTSYNTSSFNNSYEFPRCIKVSIILRMLLNTFSKNSFWNYIRTYVIKTYLDYNNLMTSWSESEKPKNINYMGISNINKSELLDMIHKIDPWTKQKHYPTISVKRDYDFIGKMIVSIENYNSSHQYYIPLTYTMQNELDFNDTTPHYWMQEMTYLMNKVLTNNFWIIFNIQQTGYYRVNYDLKNWKKIANYLATVNHTQIHVLNRAQIIDDAFHFMITKQLDSAMFWKITEYLEHELDFVAWYPMFKALEYMSSVFPLSEIETDNIKQRMQYILNKVFEELHHKKIKKDDDSTKRLKQEAAKWACFFNDQKCKEVAKYNLIRSLREPEKFKLLPWWREWTYCNGLKASSYPDIINDKNSTWWKVYHMGKENFKILEYLACFEHPDFITDYLNLIGNNNETSIMSLKDFRVQDRINCFLSTIAKYARKNKVLNFIIDKFMEIKSKEINEAVILTVLINHIYSEEQLENVKEFAIKNWMKLQNTSLKRLEENLDESLDKILEIIISIKKEQEKDYTLQFYKRIETKIQLRFHQIESQIKYLNTLVI